MESLEEYRAKLKDAEFQGKVGQGAVSEISTLYDDIKNLIEKTERKLGKIEPPAFLLWFRKDPLWQERRAQVDLLKDVMRASHQGQKYCDLELHFVCDYILRRSHTSFFSRYNDFVEQLGRILSTLNLSQININTRENIAILENRIRELENKTEEEVKMYRRTLASLTKRLGVPSIKILEEHFRNTKIEEMSAEELVQIFISDFNETVGKEIKELRDTIDRITREYATNQTEMERAFLETLKRLQHVSLVQAELAAESPEIHRFLAESNFPKNRRRDEFIAAETPSNSQLIDQLGHFRRRASDPGSYRPSEFEPSADVSPQTRRAL